MIDGRFGDDRRLDMCGWMWMDVDMSGRFGDDRRLGRAGYAPVWGLDRDLLKKRPKFVKKRRNEHDRRMIDGRFGDDRRLGRVGCAPVWGLDRDLLKKRHFSAKIAEIASK